MQEDIEELRRQLNEDAASVSSSVEEVSVSPASGRIKSVKTNSDTITQMIASAIEKSVTPMIKKISEMEQAMHKGINIRDPSQPRVIRQIVNPISNTQPGPSYAQVTGGARGRRRSMSRNNKITSAVKEDKAVKTERPIQPLKAHNPAVSLAQAFAAVPINLANRFTILSIAEDEERSYEIINEIQGSTTLAKMASIRNIAKRSRRCVAVEAESEEGAEILKEEIRRKYPEEIEISTPSAHEPLIKVTGCAV